MLPHEYEFTFWLTADSRELDDWSHAIYEAGGDDSSCGISNGSAFVTFHREGQSLEAAILSAMKTVRSAGMQVLTCEIAPEQLAAWPA